MGCVNTAKISVLQWNERLQNIEESHGLFLFRITKPSQRKSGNTHDQKSKDCSVYVFDSVKLSTPDSTEWVVSKAMEGLNFLSHEATITRVREEIAAYLFRYFRVNRDDLERKPRIVVVVDLHVSKAIKRPIALLSKADRLYLKSASRFQCVSGELRVEEIKKIRGILMFLLKEPIVLWVRPMVSCERRGIYQVQEQLGCNGDELDVDDACSAC